MCHSANKVSPQRPPPKAAQSNASGRGPAVPAAKYRPAKSGAVKPNTEFTPRPRSRRHLSSVLGEGHTRQGLVHSASSFTLSVLHDSSYVRQVCEREKVHTSVLLQDVHLIASTRAPTPPELQGRPAHQGRHSSSTQGKVPWGTDHGGVLRGNPLKGVPPRSSEKGWVRRGTEHGGY